MPDTWVGGLRARWQRWRGVTAPAMSPSWVRDYARDAEPERLRVRADVLATFRRAGYTIEPLTPAGDAGCVALWHVDAAGRRYQVAREVRLGEWESD